MKNKVRQRMGGMMTRSQFKSGGLPPGWRKFEARTAGSQEVKQYFLSPEGKRFLSVKEMKAHIKSTRVPFEEQIGSPSKIVKKMLAEKKKTEFQYIFKNNRLIMSDRIILRRAQMKLKNPFRNLRRTVLRKNLIELEKVERRRKNLQKFMNLQKLFQSRKRNVKRAISSAVVKSKSKKWKGE